MTESQENSGKGTIRAFPAIQALFLIKKGNGRRIPAFSISDISHFLNNQAFSHQVDRSNAAENCNYDDPCQVQQQDR
jgi:hypothetical protein